MLTTAGSTRLTSGAKLCCGITGAPCDSGGAAFGAAVCRRVLGPDQRRQRKRGAEAEPDGGGAGPAEPGLAAGAGRMFRHASILLMHE